MSAQAPAWMAPLQALVANPLPPTSRGRFIGLIGDHPSTYARSPRIWTPALAAFGIPASYLPLDVPAERLPAVMKVLRESEACLGANVTTPHKELVLPLLDEVDDVTAAVGAVNTIVRSHDGRLIGANTDGVGLVAALQHDEGAGVLVERLGGATVLLIGAGGGGRAAALALGPLLDDGELLIVNRSHERARALAERVSAAGGRATAVPDDLLDDRLPVVDLVINASLRGQAGIRKSLQGWTTLERYSALAPAQEVVVPPMAEDDFFAAWWQQAAVYVAVNNLISRANIQRLPARAAVFDMIYAPPQTPLLWHAQEAGLHTANGRWMNIAQAAAAFVDYICRPAVEGLGTDPQAARRDVERVMAAAWDD